MNAHKFAFQDFYILDLKPTTRTHWHSWGKLMDNRKYLKEAFSIYSSILLKTYK